MSSEDFKSLIVTDPDLVDEGIDVSGLKTTTDTSPYLLGGIPDYEGIQYSTLAPTKYTDLMRLYSEGLPMFDIPQAAAPVTTAPDTGDGGQATATTTAPTIPINPGTFTAESLDQSFAGEEGPVTQPMTGGITGDPIQMENIASNPYDISRNINDPGASIENIIAQNPSGTIDGALVVPGVDVTGDPSQNMLDVPTRDVGLAYTGDFDPDDEGTVYSDEVNNALPPEQDNVIKQILSSAGDNVQGALTQLGEVPGAIVDFANQTVDIFGKKLNVGATLAKFAINKAFGGPISLVFDIAKAVLPEESLADKTTRSIVDELKAENDYGFNMQSGNLNQDPFGRNPVSGLGDYEQTLKEDILGINQSGFQTQRMIEKKKEFAQDYFNKKAEKAGGVEVEDGTVLGPGEAPGEVVTLDDLLQEQQDKQDAALIESISGDIGVEGLDDETGRFGGGADMSFDANQDIIDRGGGDDISTGGLDPNRGQQVDRGSSGAGDNQPVSTTTGPPSTGFQPQSTYDSELEDDRDVGGGGNDGGGGSSKIVCTMMNDSYGFGSFRNKIWLRHSKDMAPEYQKGYHKIFLPLVKIAKTDKIIRKTLEHIAVHRTIDIRQESRGKIHLLGRVYRKILEPICYIVGKYAK